MQNRLDQNRLDQYRRDGVLPVRGLISDADLAGIESALERYRAEILPRLPEEDYVLEEDGHSVRNLWRMTHYDEYFKSLSERSDILALVEPLLNGECVCWNVETFNKPARTGSGVPPHQDNAYFCITPPDMLTVWIALDAVTEENGPVCYFKGSHRHGMLPHRKSGVPGNSMGLAVPLPLDRYEEYRGLMNPGDAVVHHCQTIHWSAPNKSEWSRRGLLMVYHASHVQTDPVLQRAYLG
jgi:ectoine hydroxylase-related dioxygenase (phytanoyl-CoA dioxygenase family)